jgi:hypothetical protein
VYFVHLPCSPLWLPAICITAVPLALLCSAARTNSFVLCARIVCLSHRDARSVVALFLRHIAPPITSEKNHPRALLLKTKGHMVAVHAASACQSLATTLTDLRNESTKVRGIN